MLPIAVDNCVVSHYISHDLPARLIKEKEAFEEMISLHEQKIIEIGWSLSTGLIENGMKDSVSRSKVKQLLTLKNIPNTWPVIDQTPEETQKQIECLQRIINDPDGTDSRQLVIISKLTSARHFVTTDYKFHRRFNRHKESISKCCKVNIFVMTPLEFISAYKEGKI